MTFWAWLSSLLAQIVGVLFKASQETAQASQAGAATEAASEAQAATKAATDELDASVNAPTTTAGVVTELNDGTF